MKFLGYLTDKIYKLYFVTYLIGSKNIIISLIMLYLLNKQKNPINIFKNVQKLWNKLTSLLNKKNDEIEKDDPINIVDIKENLNDSNQIIVDELNLHKNVKFNDIINDDLDIKISPPINDVPIKKNIKNIIKRTSNDPYQNDKENIILKYNLNPDNHDFKLNINNNLCTTPMFTLRTYENLDFYYNFIIHNFDTQKIYNLNMCKDIHKWMSSSYLSNEDLSDQLHPIYFIYKNKFSNQISVNEYLKFFVHTNNEGIKNGFIQKGTDYVSIKDYIDQLIEQNNILDLLNGEQYINYNLSCNEGTVNFLDKFLSLVLIPDNKIGTELTFDLSNFHDNKKTYEYYMKTINSDINFFNTSI